MKKIKITGSKSKMVAELSALDLPIGKYYVLTIEERKNTRSVLQNRYYWGCIIDFLVVWDKSHGYFTNEGIDHFLAIHQISNREHIHAVVKELTNLKDSSKLSTLDFENWLAEVRAWASELTGVIIPKPNEELSAFEDYISNLKKEYLKIY